ncbi:MAG: hypothetical protein DME59_21180 [Verrucomicrobia bacterium]|nr:MAG: hypothetical protein DME59_21180 [Verrucomicrobiota bacterium]
MRSWLSLLLFRLLNLNHLAGLKLIRQICRSGLLRLCQVRTGQHNPSTHDDENPSARTHREILRLVSGTSNHGFVTRPSWLPSRAGILRAGYQQDGKPARRVRFATATPSCGGQDA